jgi:steroid delta-isomerase-like uncharacterized protein
MATENEKIVSALIEASNSENYERMESLLADDFVYEEVATGKICHRAKEFIDFAKLVHSEFPDHKWEAKSIISSGDMAAVEAVWNGTFTNSDDPKRPATNKHATLRSVEIMELRDGKICRFTEYFDLSSMLKQLGAASLQK